MRTSKITTTHDSESARKSLTPQRKHRKLLKDGTSEVWPEEVEKIFVQGLREYWESPWATYSRGRSRWRNQFLVDYLQRAGIDRSKKQVASHIQVLRNMWKGEPEYHLVAGGEELFLETGLLAPVKSEDSDTQLSTPVMFGDGQAYSPASDLSVSTSPPSGSQSSFPRTSPSGGSMQATLPPVNDDSRRVRSISATQFNTSQQSRLSPLDPIYRSFDSTFPPAGSISCPNVNFSSGMDSLFHRPQRLSNPATSSQPPDFPKQAPVQPVFGDSPLSYNYSPLLSVDAPMRSSIKLQRLTLWAEGMQPVTVQVDALASSAQPSTQSAPAVALRIKLHLPTIDALCSPTLHGFHGSISYTAQRSSTARCSTTVLVRNECIARENNYCPVMTVERTGGEDLETMITSSLPESTLSRSRWLDASLQTCIVQKIVVNEETIAVIVYDLDRRQCENMPSAELVAVQKYASQPEKPPVHQPNYPVDTAPLEYLHAPGQCVPRSFQSTQTSLSGALTPVNTNSHGVFSFSTPMFS
ncbi:hypothetical protein BJ138DRAFT_1076232 [Hygrophoropsis aurantiaca]|uniref:Uncharacterized protein n=1 Tax=Hygrophoropsis aurantiaca TaxID=72124 RepID=A0ACB8ASX9_9AGAM|nr:hypothetical protein BJ138DRAFT_1076232 [Hygrophoropsis aurantiaca]